MRRDMEARVAGGQFGDAIRWRELREQQDIPQVRAVLWNSEEEPPNAPRQWEEWAVAGQKLLELAIEARNKEFTPKWELIPFRQERDFYAGSFKDFLQIWMIILKELDPPQRARAYSVLSNGVDIFENLKMIRFDDPIVFRRRTLVAMKHTKHESNARAFAEHRKNSFERVPGTRPGDCMMVEGWPIHRQAKYPVHVGGERHGQPLKINNPRGIESQHEDVVDTLLKWTKTGALKVLEKDEPEPLMTSAIIMVPKGNGWRVCYDGSPLTFLETRSVACKLDGVKEVMATLRKGDVLVKLDDKSAFHHLLLDPMSSKLAAMKWGDETFTYRAAAFGIPRIPGEYQLINGAPIRFLRNRGHMILLYLDDRLIIERPVSDEERENLLAGRAVPRSAFAMCALAVAGGTFIHREKSTFIPSQRLEFLGFIFDTNKETIAIPQGKWDKFKEEVENILKTHQVATKALERIRGKCVHFMYVERKMRLYIREQNEAIKQALDRGFASIPLNRRLRKELKRWLDPTLTSRETKWIETGVCELHIDMDKAERTLVYTDASGGAGGLYIEELKASEPFYWPDSMASKNIYMKEAYAILIALRRKGSLLRNRRVLMECDNQIVCSAFYNGSKKSDLNDLILNIYDEARKYNIDMRIEYVNTNDQLADEPSRTFDFNECKITDKAYREILEKWSVTPTLDAFATAENRRCESYIARYHDDGAYRRDFFTVSRWRKKEIIYAFPPPTLATLVLKYLQNYASKNEWALIALGYETVPLAVAIGRQSGLEVHKLDTEISVLRPERRFSEEWNYYKPVAESSTTWMILNRPESN